MTATNVGFSLAVLGVTALALADPEIRRKRGLFWSYLSLTGLGLLAALPGLRGTFGMVLGIAYMLVASGLAATAFLRAAERPQVPASEKGLALAHIYIVGGGVWLTVYAAQWELLGFANEWSLLTAAHFHAAGAGATAFTSLVHRATGRGAVLVALHPLAYTCVAVGLLGTPILEQVGACLYVVIFSRQAWLVVRGDHHLAVKAASLVPLVTIVLAVNWAFGGAQLTFDEMIWFHGVSNALGHVALGLGGFAFANLEPAVAPLRAPISRLRAGWRLTSEFLASRAPKGAAGGSPTGISPRFAAYRRDDFDVEALHPEVVRFYEFTRDYELEVSSQWQPGFRLGGRIWAAVASFVGQLGLPAPGTAPDAMSSLIVDVDDAVDGRENVRGWVRVWRRSGRPVYVATYAEHTTDGMRYMNIAFPTPGSNMTSILRLDSVVGPTGGVQGLALTSVANKAHSGEGTGDQGVYLRIGRWATARLPFDETICVYATDGREPGVSDNGRPIVLTATHEMWMWGRLYLRLDYRIWRRQD